MRATIGIDLGTSACSVAIFDDRGARVLPTPGGRLREPSEVAMTPAGPRAGEEARHHAKTSSAPTVGSALRLIGRKLLSPAVEWLGTGSPVSLVAAPNGDVAIHVAGRDYAVQEIVSYLIEHLRRRAERALGGDVRSAVLAVPPSFDAVQRRAVVDAARLAGLEEVALVNASTAALVSWSSEQLQARRVALVSLGAGSFDVTLADTEAGGVTVLAAAGDPMIGGDDLDRRVVIHWLDELQRKGHDVTGEPVVLQALFDRARSVRHALTDKKRSEPVVLEVGPRRLALDGISRRQLVELIALELAGLKDPCLWAFADAGLGTDDFEPVLAMGGVTRMPAVQSVIKYLFRRPAAAPPDPEGAVARGAAQIAARRFARGERDPIARDVCVQSVGIKVRGGRMLTVLPRTQRLPAVATRSFEAAGARVTFELYQGDHDVAMENTYLGRLSLTDLGPGPFAVRFALDESGLVTVARLDPETGQATAATVAPAGGLSPDDLARLASQRAERKLPSEVPTDTPPPRSFGPRRVGSEPRRRAASRPRTGDGAPPMRRPRPTVPDTLTPPPAPRRAIQDDAIRVEADSLVGTRLDGRYLIQDVLGEGGMGRVYLAEHELLAKRFAIKVLHPELAANRDLAERFIREARAASSIESDHVVAISDFGLLSDGTGYFVMEYLDGRTLEQEIDLEGPRDPPFALAVGRQVALALRGAHDRNIVHRDLKPSNIIIQRRDGRPFCKILDFGIAKSPTSDSGSTGTTIVTMAGMMMGTPHYMAPEQIDGEVDPRSDIYALGVVLFETICGVPPFDAESVAELLGMHKWSDPPAIRDVRPGAACPPALEAVIRRCLEKEASARYATAREVAEALASIPV